MKTYKLLLFFLIAYTHLCAHEVRPAYFSITQLTDSTYQAVWKIPAMGNAIPKVYPILPKNWEVINEQSNMLPDNLRRTYLLKTLHPIEGSELFFEGLNTTLIDVLISIKKADGSQYSSMLKPANPSYKIPYEPSKIEVIKTYLMLGFEHILLGIDHLLFVLALLLITKGFKRLLKTITAFTIAHSITLSLSALGVVGLPGAPVEAVIALSIVFLALELLNYQKGNSGLTIRYPWIVAFTFGLLHGFGFAGALSEIGLPQIEIPTALLFFNVGVELGQIAFVIAVLCIIWMATKLKVKLPQKLSFVPAYLIGSIASFWLVERVIALF